MDFKEYYLKQAGSGQPYFHGSPYQKGYGLGGIFRRIFKYIMPIVRVNALPVAKTIGKELIRTASNVVNDSLGGQDMKTSTMKRFSETLRNLSDNISPHEGEGFTLRPGMSINSHKRKKNKTKKKISKKRILDIFDKK